MEGGHPKCIQVRTWGGELHTIVTYVGTKWMALWDIFCALVWPSTLEPPTRKMSLFPSVIIITILSMR